MENFRTNDDDYDDDDDDGSDGNDSDEDGAFKLRSLQLLTSNFFEL